MLRQPDETMGRSILCAESARVAGRFLAVAALAFGCARGSVLGGIQAPAAALFAAAAGNWLRRKRLLAEMQDGNQPPGERTEDHA